MKHMNSIICSVILCILLLTGCGKQDAAGSKISNNNSIDAVVQNEIEKSNDTTTVESEKKTEESDTQNVEATPKGVENTEAEKTQNQKVSNVDIDMTRMSSDIIYATVYQLMTEPDTYVGKTIRMKGNYTASWYDQTEQYYHYVIIQDATACCAQGMEFLLEDESLTYPDDYPKEEQEIVVVGTFETYKEAGDENLYCRLGNAIIEE